MGSGPGKAWKFIGPAIGGTASDFERLDPEAFLAAALPCIERLPSWLRSSIPAAPPDFANPTIALTITIARDYCDRYGLAPVRKENLAFERKAVGENARELLVRSIAGINPAGCAYMREYFCTAALRDAPLVLQRANLYGDVPKVRRWCDAGGRHRRIAVSTLANRTKDDVKIRKQAASLSKQTIGRKNKHGKKSEGAGKHGQHIAKKPASYGKHGKKGSKRKK